jgi:hypothetical protein
MVRPLLLAEPGPGDASCTIWTLTVFIYLAYLRAGRPSSNSAFRSSPALRPSPYVSNLSIFFVRFRSCDLLRSRPICRSSPYVSGLATFSVLPATPTFRLVRFLSIQEVRYISPTGLSPSMDNPSRLFSYISNLPRLCISSISRTWWTYLRARRSGTVIRINSKAPSAA